MLNILLLWYWAGEPSIRSLGQLGRRRSPWNWRNSHWEAAWGGFCLLVCFKSQLCTSSILYPSSLNLFHLEVLSFYWFDNLLILARYLSSIAAVLLTLKLGGVHSQRAALLCPLLYHAIVALCKLPRWRNEHSLPRGYSLLSPCCRNTSLSKVCLLLYLGITYYLRGGCKLIRKGFSTCISFLGVIV